jgi:peptidoglycan/LPS O-acetylase OafA/YrhL
LKRYQLVVILGATTLSFAICLWGTFHKPGATFYLAPFRAWELLMGALVALVSHKVLASRLLMEVLAFSGLALILATFFLVDSQTPFRQLSSWLGRCQPMQHGCFLFVRLWHLV